MPAYVAVDSTIKDPTTHDRYKLLAPPAIAKYGPALDPATSAS